MDVPRFELLRPDELREVLAKTPVAYVPLGTLEFHGWHLPLGFDALKAHALCMLACAETGGTVLPPWFLGFEGGHRDFEGSILFDEDTFRAMVRRILGRLAAMGFRVIVLLTGHYPNQQMDAVREEAERFTARGGARALGLAEPEAYPGAFRGDHAAKWETSIAMHLMPELADFSLMAAHDDPVHGICGEDPRAAASAALGEETVHGMVATLVARVREERARAG
jgi:creatinine amidohydrolase